LTFDLGVKVMKRNPPTLFICIYGPDLNKIGSVISEKMEFSPPHNNNNNNKNNNYRAMTVVVILLVVQSTSVDVDADEGLIYELCCLYFKPSSMGLEGC